MTALLTAPITSLTVKPAKRKGEVDVLHGLKSVAGLLPRLIQQIEAESSDTSVPVSAGLLAELTARIEPGVTLRGLVKRAITAFLAAPPSCACHDHHVDPPDDHKVARLLFAKDPTCRSCQKAMSFQGLKHDRPNLVRHGVEPSLVCGDCLGWINWSAEGGAA